MQISIYLASVLVMQISIYLASILVMQISIYLASILENYRIVYFCPFLIFLFQFLIGHVHLPRGIYYQQSLFYKFMARLKSNKFSVHPGNVRTIIVVSLSFIINYNWIVSYITQISNYFLFLI